VPPVQLDRGHTNEEIEAAVEAFYRGLTVLRPPHTPIKDGAGLMHNKAQQLLVIVYSDCAVCLIMFCAILGFAAVQNRMALETEVNVMTITDYSVQVTGLPATASADQVPVCRLSARFLQKMRCMSVPVTTCSCCSGLCGYGTYRGVLLHGSQKPCFHSMNVVNHH
jgi:hypothetical protein